MRLGGVHAVDINFHYRLSGFVRLSNEELTLCLEEVEPCCGLVRAFHCCDVSTIYLLLVC